MRSVGVGVSLALFKNAARDQVLLVQRAKAPSIGLWSLPGGKVEVGETLREACLREVKEETGLDEIDVLGCFNVIDSITANHHFVIVNFLGILTNQEKQPRASDDALQALWFPISKLPSQHLCTSDLHSILQRAVSINNLDLCRCDK
jgi:ADP-ribose pyrophosphatase YjhB (NUDIX family)